MAPKPLPDHPVVLEDLSREARRYLDDFGPIADKLLWLEQKKPDGGANLMHFPCDLDYQKALIGDIFKRLAASSGRPIALLDYIERDIVADMADIRLRMGGVDPNTGPTMTTLLLLQQNLDKVRNLYLKIIAKLENQRTTPPTALLIPDTPRSRSPAVSPEGDVSSSDAPPDLIEAYHSSMGGSKVSQADRSAEAPNLPAPSKPDPELQATPQLKAAPSTNEAPPVDEAPAQHENNRRRRKRPRPWEETAYQLWEAGKYTQKEIAEMVSREFGRPLDQSQVSKAKDRVAAWKGEPKPARVPKENRPRKYNVNPQKLQQVVEASSPTLAEQMERGPVPISNGLRIRSKKND
jgi:hypothetical protein